MDPGIRNYNDEQESAHKAVCDALAKEIDAALPDAESKVWHAHPVWFLAGNPIAGYSQQKPGIRLMFWSGADFGEPGLDVVGRKFKDASVFFNDAKQIHRKALRRWLAKSREIQWDYKNIVRNKGKLTRLVPTPAAKADAKPPAKKAIPKKTPASDAGKAPSDLIDTRIAELGDWRGELLARLRRVILAADPAIVEEWKWNVPVWSCGGILCTGETYQKAVKLTFARGASVADPARLFNSSLEGNTRRAIDFAEGASVNEKALGALIRAAVAVNRSKAAKR